MRNVRKDFRRRNHFAAVGLADAQSELGPLFLTHAIANAVTEEVGVLDALDQLAGLIERQLGKQIDDLGLGVGHDECYRQ